MKALPVQVLYQFEPTWTTRNIIGKLQAVGCRNLGHLIVLRPDILRFIRARDETFWKKIYIALSRRQN